MKTVSKAPLASLKSEMLSAPPKSLLSGTLVLLSCREGGLTHMCPKRYHIKESVRKQSISRPFFPSWHLVPQPVILTCSAHCQVHSFFFFSRWSLTKQLVYQLCATTVSEIHYRWCSLWQACLQSSFMGHVWNPTTGVLDPCKPST